MDREEKPCPFCEKGVIRVSKYDDGDTYEYTFKCDSCGLVIDRIQTPKASYD